MLSKRGLYISIYSNVERCFDSTVDSAASLLTKAPAFRPAMSELGEQIAKEKTERLYSSLWNYKLSFVRDN